MGGAQLIAEFIDLNVQALSEIAKSCQSKACILH